MNLDKAKEIASLVDAIEQTKQELVEFNSTEYNCSIDFTGNEDTYSIYRTEMVSKIRKIVSDELRKRLAGFMLKLKNLE